MTDQELADELVAAGIGQTAAPPNEHLYLPMAAPVTVEMFVRDWRVSGAATEKVDSLYIDKLSDGHWEVQAILNTMPTELMVDKSLPRAINMACMAA